MDVYAIGWAHTPFGKMDTQNIESLITRVAQEALADANISANEIDEIYLGHYNGGFSQQEFTAALALQADDGLRHKPATRVENACATGSAAIYQGAKAIRAGDAKAVLVIGAEQMSTTPGPQAAENLLKASYLPESADTQAGFAGVFGQVAHAYFEKYGEQFDALARIAAKNHYNGVANPYAQIRRDYGFEFCRHESEKNPVIAAPLKRSDCSPISDGAAAIVLTNESLAQEAKRSVKFRAMSHVQDFLPMNKRDILAFEGCAVAWQRALKKANISLNDLSFVETHDCFTIAELLQYEAMGLTPAGQGRRAIDEGWTTKEGILPINPSGGLKAKGHPIGATGVSMHVLTAKQLTEELPGEMQIKNAKLGALFNMGGVVVANYVSILERWR